MKLHYPGEKGRAVCETDGLASTTFAYRDVPFSDGSRTWPNPRRASFT
jgi:hypothetical protein